MNNEKLYPQVYAIGQIYKIITDACPQAEIPHPDIFPMKTYTMAILKFNQNRKSTPQIQRMIAELSDKIEADDWDNLFGAAISTELKGAFWLGYQKGVDQTKIAAIRRKKGMTQTELAKIIGLSQKDISRWERGEVKPNSDNLKKLASALQCSIDDIL